ncbi:DUF6196 family protein [Acidisoma sp. L85]|uniref:DUF6196 family protein n=1 Tax=Acidisoma sp. L85 TaxID=1641850 RepID=UPI00131B3193|nr:DUF6196 family protein [Acidisoma sp. L85]
MGSLTVSSIEGMTITFTPSAHPGAIRPPPSAFRSSQYRPLTQLVPYDGSDGEAFGIFGFHFPPDKDNSGFVGWLASHLKTQFGSGVLVICGMNQADGGIYDYWGCPAAIAQDVFDAVLRLKKGDEM